VHKRECVVLATRLGWPAYREGSRKRSRSLTYDKENECGGERGAIYEQKDNGELGLCWVFVRDKLTVQHIAAHFNIIVAAIATHAKATYGERRSPAKKYISERRPG
jgi:hypothetical protein